jgi:phospholipase/carboxylesterase
MYRRRALLTAALARANRSTPIFVAHGIYDDVLPIQLGEAVRDFAFTRGCKVDWSTYPMPHSVCEEEIHALRAWLGTRLAASS